MSRGTSPVSLLLGGAAGLLLGTLFKYRVLPFLKPDTILSGGKQVPTAEFAAFIAHWCYIFGAVFLIGALGWFAVRALKKANSE